MRDFARKPQIGIVRPFVDHSILLHRISQQVVIELLISKLGEGPISRRLAVQEISNKKIPCYPWSSSDQRI